MLVPPLFFAKRDIRCPPKCTTIDFAESFTLCKVPSNLCKGPFTLGVKDSCVKSPNTTHHASHLGLTPSQATVNIYLIMLSQHSLNIKRYRAILTSNATQDATQIFIFNTSLTSSVNACTISVLVKEEEGGNIPNCHVGQPKGCHVGEQKGCQA